MQITKEEIKVEAGSKKDQIEVSPIKVPAIDIKAVEEKK